MMPMLMMHTVAASSSTSYEQFLILAANAG